MKGLGLWAPRIKSVINIRMIVLPETALVPEARSLWNACKRGY
jgi:hypothetical protein